MTFRTFVLWLHLLAIIVWVGGMIIVPFVVLPAVRRLSGDDAQTLVEIVTRRFQRLSRELILVILLTGIFNVINLGIPTRFSFGAEFIRLLLAKVGLFAAMAANQAWYSLALVPAATDRRRATWSAVANVVLAAAVVYLGLRLRHG